MARQPVPSCQNLKMLFPVFLCSYFADAVELATKDFPKYHSTDSLVSTALLVLYVIIIFVPSALRCVFVNHSVIVLSLLFASKSTGVILFLQKKSRKAVKPRGWFWFTFVTRGGYSINIASPILTGVGMPVWKAAKMRAFSKRRSATGSVWNATFAAKDCLYLCSKKTPCGAFLLGIVPHIPILTDAYR